MNARETYSAADVAVGMSVSPALTRCSGQFLMRPVFRPPRAPLTEFEPSQDNQMPLRFRRTR
jgi:hypothetical protein